MSTKSNALAWLKGLIQRLGDYLMLRTPPREIRQEEHYGARVWTHVDMDSRRRTECLCRLCNRCNPGQPEHCKIAGDLFKICQATDIAVAITRCPHYTPRPKQDETATWVAARDHFAEV